MLIPEEILNDLSTRFLIHLPPEEKRDPTRLCFQMELAYWFYLDYYAGEGSGLPNLSMRDFTHALFAHIPGLRKYSKRTDDIIATWKQFKFAVPTFGCILVDETLEQVLLVQGYWSKGSWGFPKGKVNENEKPHRCAAREVHEETGFDCSHMINKKLFLERRVGDHDQRLYIVPGVSRETVFLPQTKKEIRSIRWFQIKDLPTFKKDSTPTERLGINSNAFFMIMPFVKPLRKWLNKLRRTNDLGEIPPPVSPVSKPNGSQRSQKKEGQSSSLDSRRSSVEHHARRSLSRMFDEAANEQNNVNEPIAISKQNGGSHAVSNNVSAANKSAKNNKTSKQAKKSATPAKNAETEMTPVYKAPNFEIPAWANFKLDYEEYTKLVY